MSLHLLLRELAAASTLPVKGNKTGAAELVERGLARPDGKTKIAITPAGVFAAKKLNTEKDAR